MSNPGNKKTSQMNEPFHPGQQPDPMKSAINPPPPMYQASPSMPYQYQASAGPPEAIPMQPQQTILITNVQPANERDYLGYSIFTLLCCFLPLGIAALTQGANQQGDITSAKKYSRVAFILDNTAVGLGIAMIIVIIILIQTLSYDNKELLFPRVGQFYPEVNHLFDANLQTKEVS
ncbi:hypothetical protein E2320_000602, partial [Naja naja]